MKRMEKIPGVLGRLVRSYRFALAAFLIPLLRHEMLCAYPPPLFQGKISCLAWIIGESCDSGHDPGVDEKAK